MQRMCQTSELFISPHFSSVYRCAALPLHPHRYLPFRLAIMIMNMCAKHERHRTVSYSNTAYVQVQIHRLDEKWKRVNSIVGNYCQMHAKIQTALGNFVWEDCLCFGWQWAFCSPSNLVPQPRPAELALVRVVEASVHPQAASVTVADIFASSAAHGCIHINDSNIIVRRIVGFSYATNLFLRQTLRGIVRKSKYVAARRTTIYICRGPFSEPHTL